MTTAAIHEQKLPAFTLDALRDDDFFGARLLDLESDLFNFDWQSRIPSVSISADDENFYINMPVKGFDSGDFSFECQDGILFISAEKNLNDPQEDTLLFRRSFSLPEEAATSGVTALVENGRLQVSIPKIR
jgi:HSP20 family molecular chaperone IbpA